VLGGGLLERTRQDLVQLARRLVSTTIATVATPQYPLTAFVLALLFLLVQDRIDRRDPKLATAAVSQRDQEIAVPDPFGVRRPR
jgi:hypothetical protein